MNNVVVRSFVLLVVSTVIVLVSAFVLPHTPLETTKAGSSESSMAAHGMAGMDAPVESEAAFISGMIPHHQEAVESARAILATTERPELRDLAQNVVATQTKEIATLESWVERWYPDAAGANYAPMMVDPAGSSPAAAERTFLLGMIEHHQGAIDMAQAYLDAGFAKHPEVAQLAETVVAVQDGEIERMQGWLKDWYGDADPEPMTH